jgi:hypothetical protein
VGIQYPQVSAASINAALNVTGAVPLTLPQGSSTAVSRTWTGTTLGEFASTGSIYYTSGTVRSHRFYSGGSITLASGGGYNWSSTSDADGAADLLLARDAAGVLAQRNGVNAQMLRVYNTYTDASNYERASLGWAANIFTISSENLGTGAVRDVRINGGGTVFSVTQNGVTLTRDGTSNSSQLIFAPTGLTGTAQNVYRFAPSINQASGTYTVLDINPTETAVGAGPHYLAQGRLGGGGVASTFGIDRLGAFRSSLGTALTAGGTTNYGYFMSASNIGVICGSGAPTVSATKGTLYLRSDGSSSSTRAYVNTDGATTWTAITTAA